MSIYGTHPPLRLADDPSDPVWHWFICNGPHGERFHWEKVNNMPRDIYYLKLFIDERNETNRDFYEKARQVSLKALQMDNAVMVRTAIQVLCIVGEDEDMDLIKCFIDHNEPTIRNDARCCLFERRIKFKRE